MGSPAASASAALGSSLSAATTTAPQLGKWAIAASAIQALAGIGQGVAQMRAASDEANLLHQQADIALFEGERDAKQKAREVRQFAADQSSQYAASGVTLEGSPAQVLADTRRQGQQEVDALKKRAEMQAKLFNTQAARTKAAGRNAFFGAIASTGLDVLGSYARYKSSFTPAVTQANKRINIDGTIGRF